MELLIPQTVVAPVVTDGDYEIRPMVLTKEWIIGLWIKVQEFKSLFWSPEHTDVERFADILTSADFLFFEVYKFGYLHGIVYFSNITDLANVQMHGILFDRTVSDKKQLTRKLLLWVFENYPMERIEAAIAKPQRPAQRFVQAVGFKYEGVRRKGVHFRGKFVNQILYSILREEIYAAQG